MMRRLVSTTVNNMWEKYDKTKDGYLTFEQSKEFIKDAFGRSQISFTDSDVEKMLKKIDIGKKDGKISKGEMANFLYDLSKFQRH